MGVQGGISSTAFGAWIVLYAHLDIGVIKGDVYEKWKQQYWRGWYIGNDQREEELQDTLGFSHALLDPSAYVGMGNGTQIIVALFNFQDGVHQGGI